MKNISNFFVIQCHHGIGSAPNCDSNGNRKMATDGGVHTVAVMANKKRLLPSQCEQGLRITGNEEKQQEKGEISTIKGGVSYFSCILTMQGCSTLFEYPLKQKSSFARESLF